MKRESVKIWAGWLESIDNIPSRASGAELALAIFEYALDGREYTGADPWVKVLLPTIKKTIDHSLQNAENGGKGGRKKAENLKAANSTATSDASTAANSTANDTIDVDVDNRHKTIDIRHKTIEEKNIQEKSEQSSSPKFIFKKALIDRGCNDQIASDYMALRNRRKAPSTITAFERIEREANKYMAARPGSTFEDVVRLLIEHNWLGFEAAWVKDDINAQPEESEYIKAMNAQIRRQRELDAIIDKERQRRKKAAEAEAEANNK